MLNTNDKAKIISEFAQKASDTGSCEVQVAILSEQIKQISVHLKVAAKDYHSQRGLLVLVGQRKRLLKYLKRDNAARYDGLIKKLQTKGYIQK